MLRPYWMYELFVVYPDQTALHWLLTIDYPSGRLIRWRLRWPEFDFAVKNRKSKINAQADALYQLHTTGETVSEDNNDDIPVFKLDKVRVESGTNCNLNEVYFIDSGFAAIDELYPIVDDPAPTKFNAVPIGVEELL